MLMINPGGAPTPAARNRRTRGLRRRSMKTFAPPADVRHKAGVAAVIGAVVALAAACGSQSSPQSTGVGVPATSSLMISVAAHRGATPQRWTLSCWPGGSGGSHPQPAAACATLTHAKDPFAPVPHGVMCSMIDSGPQTASITGIWDGKRVAATYSRSDGCQTARWNKIGKVLGQVNPGGPMIPAGGSPATP